MSTSSAAHVKTDAAAAQPWAVCVPLENAAALGALRLADGIEVCAAGDQVWLRGQRGDKALGLRLKGLPGGRHFSVLPDRQLLPVDAFLPHGWLPQGPWVQLARWLGVERPQACNPAVVRPAIALELRRSGDYCEPSALLTTLESWRRSADDAPQVRLDRWRFAVAEDRRVLVVGQPLPSLPGQAYVDRQGIFVAAGWHWHPAVDSEVVRQLFAVPSGDIVLWNPAAWERIAANDFVRASRAAMRAAGEA